VVYYKGIVLSVPCYPAFGGMVVGYGDPAAQPYSKALPGVNSLSQIYLTLAFIPTCQNKKAYSSASLSIHMVVGMPWP